MCIPSSFPELNGFKHRVYFAIYKMREYLQKWGAVHGVCCRQGMGFTKRNLICRNRPVREMTVDLDLHEDICRYFLV